MKRSGTSKSDTETYGMQNGLQELSPLHSGGFLVKHTSLDDLFVHVQLVAGGGKDTFLHGSDCHETEYAHFVRLTNTVSTILSLKILMGIPVRVENDDRVGRLQVETQATGTGRQQEEEVVRRLVVELFEQITAIIRFRCTIQPEVLR